MASCIVCPKCRAEIVEERIPTGEVVLVCEQGCGTFSALVEEIWTEDIARLIKKAADVFQRHGSVRKLRTR